MPNSKAEAFDTTPEFARPAIRWKEAALTRTRDGYLNPTVQAWRKGQVLATIRTAQCVRDQEMFVDDPA
jgi:hypothetical protein